MRRLGELLIRPFREDLFFLVPLWLFVSAADLFYWSKGGDVVFGSYMAIHGLLECYVIALICGFFRNPIKAFLQAVFLFLGFVNLCVDTGVHSIMGYGFTDDMVAIAMGTNPSETTDFLSMYINAKMVLFVSVVTLGCIISGLILKRWQKKIPAILSVMALSVIVLGGALVTVKKSQNWGSVFLGKLYLMSQYEPTQDLRDFRHECELEHFADSPENIVLIIGESLSKSHMGLYGYGLNTTPLLSQMYEDGSIAPFDNVQSSGVGTISSFKYMMTTTGRDDDGQDWYTKLTLFDVAKAAHYGTKWISNQSSSGIHDNVVARFSELADTVVWCGQQYVGIGKHDLDEIVVPEVEKVIEDNKDSRSLYIVHLMGSHEDFHSRYPESYGLFKVDDYMSEPETKRDLLSAYDNSVLYNDYVVESLMKLFSDKEAVVLYFPDHALDVYQSSDDYVGHAKASNPVSVSAGRDIPFVVYLTDTYRQHFPEMTSRIYDSVHNQFYTEDVMYTVMDLMGANLPGEKRHGRSLFSE